MTKGIFLNNTKEVVTIKAKTTVQSKTSLKILMGQEHANIAGNVHGGEIMKLMDNVAGIVATRHAQSKIVTAKVDKLEFHNPINIGDLVICTGKICFVGNSSIEVLVEVFLEDILDKEKSCLAATGYFTMVALDSNGNPMKVPSLKLTNIEEERLFEERKEHYLKYKKK